MLAGPRRRHRQGGLMREADRGLDEGQEDLYVAQQIVGLASRQRAIKARLGGGSLGGAGGEEGGPLGQLGSHLGQQHPGVARTANPARPGKLRPGPRGEDCRRASQRGQMGGGVTLGRS